MDKHSGSIVGMVLQGFIVSRELGLTKEHDIALCIQVELERHHKLVKKSQREVRADIAEQPQHAAEGGV